jgi:hypothetical protein
MEAIMKFNYTSFEDTLSFAESLGWTEPETEEWDHNAADEIEFDAIRFIEDNGYEVEFSKEAA